MEEAEHSRYVSQLKAEFDSCDTTATGFLDREELTALCRKLQLDAHLPLLLATLLGERRYGRVNFEEFKEGFVAVLSRSLDFGTSEDDSSYLEPAVPEEVKPKLVKGAKRYGRRSKPDAALTRDSEDSPPSRAEASDSSPTGIRKAKLRRATSLESVESLKSDEEARSQKETSFQCKGTATSCRWSEVCTVALCDDISICIDLSAHKQEVDVLLRKLDPDLDGRVSIREFKKVLCGSTPITCSTPVRQADLRAPHKVSEEHSARSASPSLLMATVGQRVLSRLDDGSGCTSPERVAALWTEEGIGNSRDILQVRTLDFPLEERLSLADLTLALDNELLVSGNGIHQATLISYKIEIQHLEVAEQACRERDKVKADLERADRRNLQLVREVDDRHASMETLNQSRIRDLEQDFRDRLTALRSETEQESEALLQHIERERGALQEELQLLRAQEAELQEELCNAVQENGRLEEELNAVKMKLTEAEGSARRLQRDLDQMLSDKVSKESLYAAAEVKRQVTARELQDRNDELSSELELLKNQRRNRKCRRRAGATNALSWNQQHSESDSGNTTTHKYTQKLLTRQTPLCSLDDSGPAVSIQTELALEQLKQKHEEELQQLNIQLETQMNYYERSLEKMRQSMEVERKDISQAFKLEISELEEQKSQVEQQVKQLKETVDKLQTQIQHGGGRSNEQERRMQRERAELEQNFAREIGNLVQRLSAEKDQLEAELKLKMDQEVMLVRTQLEEVRSENAALQERLGALQQEVHKMEDEVAKKRRKLEEMEREHERSREEEERLHRENSRYREEVLDLSSRNLQLSTDNAELSTRLRGDQESVRMLHERLATVSKEQEEEHATVRRLQDAALQHEREKLQLQASWTQEKQLLEAELSTSKEKVGGSELKLSLSLSLCHMITEPFFLQVEKLQQSVLSLESEAELLRSQLAAISQEKLSHAQDATELQRKLQEAQSRVEELEAGVRKLMREKEELRQALQEQEEQASVTLQEETCKLGVQNQELQHQVLSRCSWGQKELKSRLSEAEEARIQAQDQAVRADAALSVAQAQHLRQQQEDNSCRDWAEVLQARLMEEQRSRLQLEEELRQQEQKSSSQISTKQDQYEKAMAALQQRAEDVETKLKAVRLLLQEKVEQLKEQLARNAKSSALLKDLYVENSQLMKALQVTEQRQKRAEKKNFLLEEKVGALNKLLRDIVPASLAT
uniref:Ninein like n=1 Tax=Pundamilia nyererei TaxID=303518 RepID=A0A3B4GUC3_9CICH